MSQFIFRNSENLWIVSGWLIAGFIVLRLKSIDLAVKRWSFLYLALAALAVVASLQINGCWRTALGFSISSLATLACLWLIYSLFRVLARRFSS